MSNQDSEGGSNTAYISKDEEKLSGQTAKQPSKPQGKLKYVTKQRKRVLLGESDFGKAYLVQDEEGAFFAQKEFKEFSEDNEIEIDIILKTNRGWVIPTKKPKKPPHLITPFIHYESIKDAADKPYPDSCNLAAFIKKHTNPINPDSPESPLFAAFTKNNITHTLTSIADSMHNEVTKLHAEGIIWGDCAIRNFLVPIPKIINGVAKIIVVSSDFGQAKWMEGFIDEDGNPTGIRSGYSSTKAVTGMKLPTRILDYYCVDNIYNGKPRRNIRTTRTDLFGLKAAMIDLIPQSLGYREDFAIKLPGDRKAENPKKLFDLGYSIRRENLTDSRKELAKIIDETRLAYYLQNAVRLLHYSKDIPEDYKKAIQKYIDLHHDYMTSMPEIPVTDDNLSAHERHIAAHKIIVVEDKKAYARITQNK